MGYPPGRHLVSGVAVAGRTLTEGEFTPLEILGFRQNGNIERSSIFLAFLKITVKWQQLSGMNEILRCDESVKS